MKTSSAVILANGSYPVHRIPLGYLDTALHIICCDGSTGNLLNKGYEPEAIVGDLDSLEPWIQERFPDRLFRDEDQETNDLTKAVRWCHSRGYDDVTILGATGKREDHTLGNISLLAEYAIYMKVRMITDTGEIFPLTGSGVVSASPGQQISVFAVDSSTRVTSRGLKYEMNGLVLHNWWRATLNEAAGYSFELEFTGGPLLVYRKFMV